LSNNSYASFSLKKTHCSAGCHICFIMNSWLLFKLIAVSLCLILSSDASPNYGVSQDRSGRGKGSSKSQTRRPTRSRRRPNPSQPKNRPGPAPVPPTAPPPIAPPPVEPPVDTSMGGDWPYTVDGDSPLILDTNKDNKISVIKGLGIAIDPSQPYKKLGAAVAGDKMLAMAAGIDGEIDGTEVFGDETFDPFSSPRVKIGAFNGFEALKFIAEKAQSLNPDLQVVASTPDHGILVNLKQLKQALQRAGNDLGLVEGADDTVLESLGDAESISLEYFTDSQDMVDGVEFKQKGFYLDSKGEKHLVVDVWFPKDVSGVSGVIDSKPANF
jgi:hypothetical protein